MIKFTQEEFDNFPVNEQGYKVCPSGDYTDIKEFGEVCSFGEECSFGVGCGFGKWCSFSRACSFGEVCSFGEACSFSRACSFGDGCSFGRSCSFSEACRFGKWCSFGAGCRFGACCRFGEWCRFSEGCSFGAVCNFEKGRVKNGKYFACDRIGSKYRKTYFFIDGDKNIFVRADCFFGTESEFIAKLSQTHKGTKYEKHYIMALELAKSVLLEE